MPREESARHARSSPSPRRRRAARRKYKHCSLQETSRRSENLATRTRDSLHCDEVAQLTEVSLADAANHQQVLGPAERAIAFALLDDARGERRPDTRQLLKLLARRAT